MIKKYISKFTIDILPSIMATIVGAYIVNHYIVPKNDADKPAAAMASVPDPKAESKADTKAVNFKPAESSADVVNPPDPKAKADKPLAEKASTDKGDKPDTASAPAEPRRHQPVTREKSAKTAPAPTPVIANAAPTAPAAEAPTAAEERRDANDLARAAIDRLRSAKEAQPASQEAARVQESSRTAPVPAMQQLPPPINVSTPSMETYGSAPSRPLADAIDPRRPRPPGEIPGAPPLDLQADLTVPRRPERTNVAEDVLSAARSVFHSVIPHQFER